MFAHIAPAFLEEILRFLAPTFVAGAGGSIKAARDAALASLAAYDAQTEQEIRLAAQITMSGFIILETLAQSMNPELACNTVLRLRGNANATQRALNQCQRALDKLQKARRQAEQQGQPVQTQSYPATTAEPIAQPPEAVRPATTLSDPESAFPATTKAPSTFPKVHAAEQTPRSAPSQPLPQTVSAQPANPAARPALLPAA